MVTSGDRVGLVGAMEPAKSTLLKILAGLMWSIPAASR